MVESHCFTGPRTSELKEKASSSESGKPPTSPKPDHPEPVLEFPVCLIEDKDQEEALLAADPLMIP